MNGNEEIGRPPKRLDESLLIALPEKNLLPVIATGDYTIEQSFGMNSQVTGIGLSRRRQV
jgi:hypothetical protein